MVVIMTAVAIIAVAVASAVMGVVTVVDIGGGGCCGWGSVVGIHLNDGERASEADKAECHRGGRGFVRKRMIY